MNAIEEPPLARQSVRWRVDALALSNVRATAEMR
jgi:hypothetical protein